MFMVKTAHGTMLFTTLRNAREYVEATRAGIVEKDTDPSWQDIPLDKWAKEWDTDPAVKDRLDKYVGRG